MRKHESRADGVTVLGATTGMEGTEETRRRPTVGRPRPPGGVRLLAALGLALVVALAPLGESPATCRQPAGACSLEGAALAEAAGAAGRLLLPRASGLHVLDPASGVEQALYTSREVVQGAAWSADGSRVAFAQFGRDGGGRLGADLYLFDESGARPAITRASPDQLLANPLWAPDGRSLIYGASGFPAGFAIEQAALDGSERRTLESGALGPSLSPDGRLLAFVRVGATDGLLVRPLAGGEARVLLEPNGNVFIGLSSPRFSPDGRRLAFLGIGGPPGGRLPRPSTGWAGRSAGPSVLAAPRLGLAVARAHGIPWDPWVINLDGSGLRQVANLLADDPNLAWSPDGSALAVLGGDGLWLVRPDAREEPVLLSHGSYGALDWRP